MAVVEARFNPDEEPPSEPQDEIAAAKENSSVARVARSVALVVAWAADALAALVSVIRPAGVVDAQGVERLHTLIDAKRFDVHDVCDTCDACTIMSLIFARGIDFKMDATALCPQLPG